MLKPQDIVILLKILSKIAISKNYSDDALSQNQLAVVLCMSVSEIHAGLKRLISSGLLTTTSKNNQKAKMIFSPIRSACEECLISGVKYFFPVQLGSYTRGIATSYAAAPLFEKDIVLGSDPIPVWPYEEGSKQGLALKPLYYSVPKSLAQYPDQIFYELLALLDARRTEQVKDQNLVIKLLREKVYCEPTIQKNVPEVSNVKVAEKSMTIQEYTWEVVEY